MSSESTNHKNSTDLRPRRAYERVGCRQVSLVLVPDLFTELLSHAYLWLQRLLVLLSLHDTSPKQDRLRTLCWFTRLSYPKCLDRIQLSGSPRRHVPASILVHIKASRHLRCLFEAFLNCSIISTSLHINPPPQERSISLTIALVEKILRCCRCKLVGDDSGWTTAVHVLRRCYRLWCCYSCIQCVVHDQSCQLWEANRSAPTKFSRRLVTPGMGCLTQSSTPHSLTIPRTPTPPPTKLILSSH